MAAERQKEIEKLQDITTSLTLQLRERDEQIEELKQSLKGNYYNMYCRYLASYPGFCDRKESLVITVCA